ncbi:MAG: glycine zipper family protein [Proteobacteria bacterium]|nr:glycine zipper family protein [Pseudomonadota bacterium]MBU1058973.1 glycine zipper family protein [Pseudomonadota bacterium]
MELTRNNQAMEKRGAALAQKCFRDGVAVICLSAMLTSCAPVLRVKQSSTETVKTVDTTVYSYPVSGQTKAQQDRDYYECSLWAVEQSGFDPELERLASEQRIEVVPATPPGSDVVAGAATGAIVGSILAGRHNHGEGLIFGTITGLFFGLASEHAKAEQAKELQARLNEQEWLRVEKLADEYRRAMSVCLEGLGYNVQ